MSHSSSLHNKRRYRFIFLLYSIHQLLVVYVFNNLAFIINLTLSPPQHFYYSELERQRYSVLIVCHLAVLRCIYAYFMDIKVKDAIKICFETVSDVFHVSIYLVLPKLIIYCICTAI